MASGAARVDAIHHVGLIVDDLDSSLPFYLELLGLHQRDDRPEFGVRGAWLDIGANQAATETLELAHNGFLAG